MSNANSIYSDKNQKQNTYICEVCNTQFIPKSDKHSTRFCSKSCHAKYASMFSLSKKCRDVQIKKLKETIIKKKQEKLSKIEPYICETCGKTVLPENYYGSGRFCSSKCARGFSSKYANTEEKKHQKSNTLKSKEKVLKHCKKCGTEIYVHSSVTNVLCDNCKLVYQKIYKLQKSNKTNEIYNKIISLQNNYNLYDIEKILQIHHSYYKSIIKLYNIKENPIFISARKISVINLCKTILNKETSITNKDLEQVKQIISKHIFEDNISPKDIAVMYNYSGKPETFSAFLTNCLHIKLKSLKESVISYLKRIGYYETLSERELYYKKCDFKFSESLYPKIKGYELLEKYGWYNQFKNWENGVVKDHRISKIYGFNNNIDPYLISHPANCEFMLQKDNSIKKENCSLTIDELKQLVKEWNEKYSVYN